MSENKSLKDYFKEKLAGIKEVPPEEMGVKVPRIKKAKSFEEIRK